MKHHLFVFSGPSGAGKSTIIKAVQARMAEQLSFSVSATTRPHRPGEESGKQYHFISEDHFQALIQQGKFIEYVCKDSHYYGTLWTELLRANYTNLACDVDISGALAIRQYARDKPFDVCLIFIAPPSLEELEKRLRHRNLNDQMPEAEILARLARANDELAASEQFNYTIVNDSEERAVEEVVKIIKHIIAKE